MPAERPETNDDDVAMIETDEDVDDPEIDDDVTAAETDN